jgi:hypothetical protein
MPSIRAAPARPDASVAGGLGPEAVSALARVHTRACIDVLVAALSGSSVRDRIVAAERLLAIGHGQAVQPFVLDASGLHVVVHTADAPGARSNGEDEPAGWERFHEREG